jgi:hypothetical protein
MYINPHHKIKKACRVNNYVRCAKCGQECQVKAWKDSHKKARKGLDPKLAAWKGSTGAVAVGWKNNEPLH